MRAAFLAGVAMLAGCDAAPPAGTLPVVSVSAKGETVPVATGNADAADDPAIWRNPADPAQSLIVATDKKAGLYVYGLDGKVRSFDPAGRLNNVDLIDLGARGVLVAASDRNDETVAKIRLYRLDGSNGRLNPLGTVPGGAGEGYGICLARAADGLVDAFLVLKQGTIEHIRIRVEGAQPSSSTIRRLSVPTQAEGCIVDERTNQLYVGEEDAGIWRFDARPEGSTSGTMVAAADGKQLVADVEGLALAPEGAESGYLIASSQGDNAFALYRLPDMTSAGRFRVVRGRFGSTEETDGIALLSGDFGPTYPQGLFVAQDGMNEPAAQNFKLISWLEVLDAVRSRP